MDIQKHSNVSEQIPANRRLIEELYAHGKITPEARDYSLNLIYPRDRWGVWVSRLLLTIGTVLVLSGIACFFAYNWVKIYPAAKLTIIQAGIVGCLAGAWFYSLKSLGGQIFLLSASVLVGVFMAVLGQIYQTGADAYQLFLMWSMLTLGWTLVSNFVAQWMFWLVVSNLALVLWWQQAAQPVTEMKFMIFTYMAILNGSVLVLREYFALQKAYEWPGARWTRVLLVFVTIAILMVPAAVFLVDPRKATISVIISSVISLFVHVEAYYFYRYKAPDIFPLAIILLSVCIIADYWVFDFVFDRSLWKDESGYLINGFVILGTSTLAAIHLKKVSKKLEADHDQI